MCPVNLLGRNLMTKLGIAVIPDHSDTGMKACRVNLKTAHSDEEDETETFVCEGLMLNSWYSLDLVKTELTQELIQLVKTQIPPAEMKNVEIHMPEELHCTMYFRNERGPDMINSLKSPAVK